MYEIAGVSGKSNNQEFRFEVSGVDFVFRLHTFRDILYCSVYANGTLVAPSVKCMNNKWLLPYSHLAAAGNFMFINSYEGYVETAEFGKITKLVYFSPEEYRKAVGGEESAEG